MLLMSFFCVRMLQTGGCLSGSTEELIALLGIAEEAKATPAAQAHGRPKKGAVPENSTFSKGSTSARYRIARLKRDHPEVAVLLESGEFKTVADAERAANHQAFTPPARNAGLPDALAAFV